MRKPWIVGCALAAMAAFALLANLDRPLDERDPTEDQDVRQHAGALRGTTATNTPPQADEVDPKGQVSHTQTPDELVIPKAPAGIVRVSIHFDEQTPRTLRSKWLEDADAWVLPASGRGTDYGYEVTHANFSEGIAVLGVPKPELYDVGIRCGPHVHIEQDVEIGRDDAEVRFTPPGLGTIEITCSNPVTKRWIEIEFSADLPNALVYPGRDDERKIIVDNTRVQKGTETLLVPRNVRLEVFASPLDALGHEQIPRTHSINFTPEFVRAGGTLHVTLTERSKVTVHIDQVNSSWDKIHIVQNGHLASSAAIEPDTTEVELFADNGPAELHWFGQEGLGPFGYQRYNVSGAMPLTVRGHTTVAARLEHQPSDAGPPVGDKATLVCVLPQGSRVPPKDRAWASWAEKRERRSLLTGNQHRVSQSFLATGTPVDKVFGVVPPVDRSIEVRWGDFLGTTKLPETSPHQIDVRLRRGGYLAVPYFKDGEGQGPVRLSRADRGPLWLDEKSYCVVSTRTGVTLGPLLPGPHEFCVWIGATKFRVIRGHVVAGETRPLNIRSR